MPELYLKQSINEILTCYEIIALEIGRLKETASNPIRVKNLFYESRGEQPFGLLLKVHGTWVKGPAGVSRALRSENYTRATESDERGAGKAAKEVKEAKAERDGPVGGE